MIYNTDARQLHKSGEAALREFQLGKHSLDERLALFNYITIIYPAIADVRGTRSKFTPKSIITGKKRGLSFLNLHNKYSEGVPEIFIRDKEFHSDYIADVFVGVTNRIFDIKETEYSLDDLFKRKEYFDVFYLFMQSLGLEKLFLNLVNNGQIYGVGDSLEENSAGYTIFNPFTHESFVFINFFDYSVDSMFTLAHEIGHVYDFDNFSENIKKNNIYQYQSLYKEVISRLFERLFVDYMLRNNIKSKAVIDILFDMESNNYDFLSSSYVFSLLDSEYIRYDRYKTLSSDELASLIKKGFKGYKKARNFLEEGMPLDLDEDLTYFYGDIISMFLFERIKEDNYSLDSLKLFFEKCHGLFDVDSFMSVAGSSDEYLELYKKETKILVKK